MNDAGTGNIFIDDPFGAPTKEIESFQDLKHPFSLAGFKFDPNFESPTGQKPTARLSASGDLHISSAAYQTFGLGRYGYAQVFPSEDRKALAILLTDVGGRPWRRLSMEKSATCAPKISVRPILRACPGLVGKRLSFRETEQEGAFVAVWEGEGESS